MKTSAQNYYDFWDSVLKLYPNGIRQKRAVSRVPSGRAAGGGGLRGSIRGFSRHSALRLRDALLSRSLPVESRSVALGLTLTLPWHIAPDMSSSDIESDYRIAFNRFCVAFRRRFPSSAAIFRHELQQRRAPHCHIVFFLSLFDFDLKSRGRSANIAILRDIIFSFWARALLGSDSSFAGKSPFSLRYDLNISGFQKRGVNLCALNSTVAQYRYIADHASKHKKSQLGYKGKQWGFINKSLLVPVSPVEVDLRTPNDRICFVRHIGRVIRFRVPDFFSKKKHRISKSSKPLLLPSDRLKTKLSKPLAGRSVVFVSSSTSRALLDWINGFRNPGYLV